MAKHHYTVSVQVQEVTPAQPAVTGPRTSTGSDSKQIERQVDEVVKVTTRGDTKREAVEKAIRMLEAEAEQGDDE